jgi:hypothetical protein
MRHFARLIVASVCVGFSALQFHAHAQQNKPATANQCDDHLKVHGLLSRAYHQCNFTFGADIDSRKRLFMSDG